MLLVGGPAGIIAAMFFGLFGDEFEISKEQLTIGESNTIILDKDGNVLAETIVNEDGTEK